MERRYPRDRRGRSPRKAATGRRPVERRSVRHPQFGEIPLILEKAVAPDGESYERWRYDPAYEPKLPPGAVRGDIMAQLYCPMCDVPRYFYVDDERTCVQCGEQFTFGAEEQKYWYEILKFHFGSVAIRCLTCRRQRRTLHALREQIAAARAALRKDDRSPSAHLALARALVDYHERSGAGDLADAISAARKAASLWPEAAEPALWEGIAQARAGRVAQARRLLKGFLGHSGAMTSTLEQRARAYLERLG